MMMGLRLVPNQDFEYIAGLKYWTIKIFGCALWDPKELK